MNFIKKDVMEWMIIHINQANPPDRVPRVRNSGEEGDHRRGGGDPLLHEEH